MKTIALILALTFMLSDTTITPEPEELPLIDEDFFKRELQNAVLEFASEAGIHPDSIYVPYRDELD